MEPLRIDWTLVRPMAVPDFPIHLDALLAWASVQEATEMGRPDPFSAQEDLPLATRGTDPDAVWCASQLLYVPDEPPHLEFLTRRFEIMDFARAKGRVYDGGQNAFQQGTGPYKAFLLSTPVQWARHITAYAIGDGSRVDDLLERVRSLGKYSRLGFGLVGAYEVSLDPRAKQAWRYRTLPTPEPGYAPVEATTRPPYWQREARRLAWRPLDFPEELTHATQQ